MAKSADPKTVAQQFGALASLPVTRRDQLSLRPGRLRWVADLQPTPLSRIYTVRLDYVQNGGAPRVRILKPDLHADGVRQLPHVYPGDVLCLCYPHQWDDGKLISRTIVPWVAEWLLHYEIWKATGDWHGGGHEPALLEAA